MHRQIFSRFTLLLALLVSMPLLAEETIKMDGMSVIGNKESPNLLYIVRWKSPKIPDMEGPMILSRIFNKALEPVERETLLREERYREAKQLINDR